MLKTHITLKEIKDVDRRCGITVAMNSNATSKVSLVKHINFLWLIYRSNVIPIKTQQDFYSYK